MLPREGDLIMQCEHCKEEIPQSSFTAFTVTIDYIDPEALDDTKFNFCCVECAAIWFNARAGEILMPDLDHEHCQDVKW
jgi:hypothetical protein